MNFWNDCLTNLPPKTWRVLLVAIEYKQLREIISSASTMFSVLLNCYFKESFWRK